MRQPTPDNSHLTMMQLHSRPALPSAPHNVKHLSSSTSSNPQSWTSPFLHQHPTQLLQPLACLWKTFTTSKRICESPPEANKGGKGQGWPSSPSCSSHLGAEAGRVFVPSHHVIWHCQKLWTKLLVQSRVRECYWGGWGHLGLFGNCWGLSGVSLWAKTHIFMVWRADLKVLIWQICVMVWKAEVRALTFGWTVAVYKCQRNASWPAQLPNWVGDLVWIEYRGTWKRRNFRVWHCSIGAKFSNF